MDKTTVTEEITVRDIFCAAFLLMHDLRPTHTFRVGSVIYGAYIATDDVKRAMELWESPATMVPASVFAGAYHKAKRMFFNNDSDESKHYNKVEGRTG